MACATIHSVIAGEGSEAAAGEVLKEGTILPLIYQALSKLPIVPGLIPSASNLTHTDLPSKEMAEKDSFFHLFILTFNLEK